MNLYRLRAVKSDGTLLPQFMCQCLYPSVAMANYERFLWHKHNINLQKLQAIDIDIIGDEEECGE